MTDWLDHLDGADYRWDDCPPQATEQEIATLAQFVGRPLPDDYVSFLRRHNGGALWYRDIWYLDLWRAADIPAWSAAYGFTLSRIPGAVCIGSDGGSEGLVLDARPERPDGQYPIYAINFVSIDWAAALAVSPDFRSLLLLRHELLGQ
ncbi:MAG TPA: SMI1/KNR4 family protein [Ktedonobacterales bacterium]|nr:SMI1/KNR4 family protein [Ktedonobacterales bacterium]